MIVHVGSMFNPPGKKMVITFQCMYIHLTFRDTNTLDVLLAQDECPTGSGSLRARPIIGTGFIHAWSFIVDAKLKQTH